MSNSWEKRERKAEDGAGVASDAPTRRERSDLIDSKQRREVESVNLRRFPACDDQQWGQTPKNAVSTGTLTFSQTNRKLRV